LNFTFGEACARLGLAPGTEGYALWALFGTHRETGQPHRQTLVTTFVDDTERTLSLWRMGIEAALPPLVGPGAADAVVKALDGWPVPLEPVPELAGQDFADPFFLHGDE
jgi:hypothetical protein